MLISRSLGVRICSILGIPSDRIGSVELVTPSDKPAYVQIERILTADEYAKVHVEARDEAESLRNIPGNDDE